MTVHDDDDDAEMTMARSLLGTLCARIDSEETVDKKTKDQMIMDIANYANNVLNRVPPINPPGYCLAMIRFLELNKFGATFIFLAMSFVLIQNIIEFVRIRKCPGSMHAPPFIILSCRLTFVILSFLGGVCMVTFAYMSIKDKGLQLFSIQEPLSIILCINFGVALVNMISLVLLLVNYHATLKNPAGHELCSM